MANFEVLEIGGSGHHHVEGATCVLAIFKTFPRHLRIDLGTGGNEWKTFCTSETSRREEIEMLKNQVDILRVSEIHLPGL